MSTGALPLPPPLLTPLSLPIPAPLPCAAHLLATLDAWSVSYLQRPALVCLLRMCCMCRVSNTIK